MKNYFHVLSCGIIFTFNTLVILDIFKHLVLTRYLDESWYTFDWLISCCLFFACIIKQECCRFHNLVYDCICVFKDLYGQGSENKISVLIIIHILLNHKISVWKFQIYNVYRNFSSLGHLTERTWFHTFL